MNIKKKLSNEHKEKIKESLKKSIKEYICPHCNKIGKGNRMLHFHFDNCKYKSNKRNEKYENINPLDKITITSEILSSEFTTYYKTLETYTKGQLKSAKKNIDHTIILSECYLHLEKHKESIETINDILIFSKKFIRSNINWYNSIIYKEIIKEKFSEEVSEYYTNDYIINKIDIENKFKEFNDTLNRYDKGLYHIYFTLNKQNIADIQNHLNISKTSAYRTLLECKNLENQFKNFLLKYL